MKKSIISMMLIGMMMLGTGTSFGKSVNHNDKNSPKQEMVVNQNHKSDKQCDCKTCKDLLKKHQTKKVQKKNQCTCKECQKQQKQQKSGPTCKIQPNTSKVNNRK